MIDKVVSIIGAGLAGCEAAYQLSKRNIKVRLYEMKPEKHSPAHKADTFAELVCSNSLRSDRLENAVGLLKEEMRLLDSLILRAADNTAVPAGGALAVNRDLFSNYITDIIKNDPNIEVISGEVTSLAMIDGIKIIATGPLTSDALFNDILDITGQDSLYFYDAAAPIVTRESIDFNNAFEASRYERGNDYLNCPMTSEEYNSFYTELITAECTEIKDYEKHIFEGCMPIEAMAMRGPKTLLFGPLKPVGLIDPHTGKQPFCAVQLRKEDAEGKLFNLVGFQTHLKFPEQKRVFSLIPALKNAEFIRFGVMHRNTFLNSPKLLNNRFRLKNNADIYFAGQITGVEGYIESAASGLLCGIYCYDDLNNNAPYTFSSKTAIGSLSNHVSNSASYNFQPMNVNFGIMDSCSIKNKKQRNEFIIERALEEIRRYINA